VTSDGKCNLFGMTRKEPLISFTNLALIRAFFECDVGIFKNRWGFKKVI
jgi:hypothetical protein